jgi:hypothetical protein
MAQFPLPWGERIKVRGLDVLELTATAASPQPGPLPHGEREK